MRGAELRRVIGYATTAVVITSVVAALVLIDSPERMRARRLDETRISDLSAIASVADCYYTVHKTVPADLAALEAGIRETTADRALPSYCHWSYRVDPETGAPYEMEAQGGDRFALCATFILPWPEEGEVEEPVAVRTENRFAQDRPAGRHCFKLIAKDLEFDK